MHSQNSLSRQHVRQFHRRNPSACSRLMTSERRKASAKRGGQPNQPLGSRDGPAFG